MERDDLPTMRALGFEEEELRALGLWDVATGDPADLAEAYIRRSKKSDDLASLRGHIRDICRTALSEGKRIRHVWFEQKSASKAYVKREEFDKAISAVKAGLSKTLYIWKTDRLSRRGMGHVGLLLDEFDKRGARIVSVTEGLDSSKGSRMVFAILSERARDEAKDISLRTKNGMDSHKTEGKWLGGVTPYGLECVDGKLRHKAAEYPTARRIAELLLDAVTPAEVAETLNKEKIRTRKGKQWRAQTIIHLAHSPSWAGLIPNRERATDEFGQPLDKWYRGGEPLMGNDGHPITCGQGVVTYAEWVKINELISGRSRAGTAIGDRTRGIRKAATIMTGILRCPHCKGPMGNGGRNYRCQARINQGPSVCKGVASQRERIDDAMGSLWVSHVLRLSPESPTIINIARRFLNYQDPEKQARKGAVSAALDSAVSREIRLNKEFFVGGMDETQYETLRNDLGAQIASLKAELAELEKEADLTPLMSAEALAVLWDAEGLEGKRALLSAALKSVTLLPAKFRGDRTPITERLVPDWRDKDGMPDDVLEGARKTMQRRREHKLAEEVALSA
ncbi:recombinase family protein [Streptomyces niveiscabiei]|uniref:recombinase family protein n=1 Tax=Streptomyces niveiscabiei TaxID=164115 RepID=UPI0029AE55E4|nr:recombinase family protein [Streptomyces niveiscabiei]MDX3385573.1 recombinase family protein [Streptomyces niveiscabiei]